MFGDVMKMRNDEICEKNNVLLINFTLIATE